MDITTKTYTEAQATDEAMLLLTRKLRRLHPEAFADLWSKLPDGARDAIHAAEIRADVVRDQREISGIAHTWAVVSDE